MRRIIIAALLTLLPFVAHAQGINNPCPIATASVSGCTAYGASAGTAAQGNDARIVGQEWNITRITNNVTFSSSSLTPIQFNNAAFDTGGVCNVSSTYVCTPTLAGKYEVTCGANVTATTGPALEGFLESVQITLNSTVVLANDNRAQAATLASPVSTVQTHGLVVVNGSTDTLGCSVYSDSTTPIYTASSGGVRTFFSAAYVGQ